MYKTVTFKLDIKDEFFTKMKSHLLKYDFVVNYDINTYIDRILLGVFNAFKDEVKGQKNNSDGCVEITFRDEENIWPHYHDSLESHIDYMLNQRVHTTTLERICSAVDGYMCITADEQEKQRLEKSSSASGTQAMLECVDQSLAGLKTDHTNKSVPSSPKAG